MDVLDFIIDFNESLQNINFLMHRFHYTWIPWNRFAIDLFPWSVSCCNIGFREMILVHFDMWCDSIILISEITHMNRISDYCTVIGHMINDVIYDFGKISTCFCKNDVECFIFLFHPQYVIFVYEESHYYNFFIFILWINK